MANPRMWHGGFLLCSLQFDNLAFAFHMKGNAMVKGTSGMGISKHRKSGRSPKGGKRPSHFHTRRQVRPLLHGARCDILAHPLRHLAASFDTNNNPKLLAYPPPSPYTSIIGAPCASNQLAPYRRANGIRREGKALAPFPPTANGPNAKCQTN